MDLAEDVLRVRVGRQAGLGIEGGGDGRRGVGVECHQRARGVGSGHHQVVAVQQQTLRALQIIGESAEEGPGRVELVDRASGGVPRTARGGIQLAAFPGQADAVVEFPGVGGRAAVAGDEALEAGAVGIEAEDPLAVGCAEGGPEVHLPIRARRQVVASARGPPGRQGLAEIAGEEHGPQPRDRIDAHHLVVGGGVERSQVEGHRTHGPGRDGPDLGPHIVLDRVFVEPAVGGDGDAHGAVDVLRRIADAGRVRAGGEFRQVGEAIPVEVGGVVLVEVAEPDHLVAIGQAVGVVVRLRIRVVGEAAAGFLHFVGGSIAVRVAGPVLGGDGDEVGRFPCVGQAVAINVGGSRALVGRVRSGSELGEVVEGVGVGVVRRPGAEPAQQVLLPAVGQGVVVLVRLGVGVGRVARAGHGGGAGDGAPEVALDRKAVGGLELHQVGRTIAIGIVAGPRGLVAEIRHFPAVRESVAIGVGVRRVGAAGLFLEVGESVDIGIVGRVVAGGIESVEFLIPVLHAVGIGVVEAEVGGCHDPVVDPELGDGERALLPGGGKGAVGGVLAGDADRERPGGTGVVDAEGGEGVEHLGVGHGAVRVEAAFGAVVGIDDVGPGPEFHIVGDRSGIGPPGHVRRAPIADRAERGIGPVEERAQGAVGPVAPAPGYDGFLGRGRRVEDPGLDRPGRCSRQVGRGHRTGQDLGAGEGDASDPADGLDAGRGVRLEAAAERAGVGPGGKRTVGQGIGAHFHQRHQGRSARSAGVAGRVGGTGDLQVVGVGVAIGVGQVRVRAGVGRADVGAGVGLLSVQQAVAVAVGLGRRGAGVGGGNPGAGLGLDGIEQAVVVGVGQGRVRARMELDEIGQAVAVRIIGAGVAGHDGGGVGARVFPRQDEIQDLKIIRQAIRVRVGGEQRHACGAEVVEHLDFGDQVVEESAVGRAAADQIVDIAADGG